MGIQDQRKDAFFDGCMKYVTEKYGPSIRFEHVSDPTCLSTVLSVAPGDGDIRCFVPGDKTWKVMEDDDIHVNIAHTSTSPTMDPLRWDTRRWIRPTTMA